MSFSLKGGVLIIGSLFWQDHRNKKGDNIRKNWRETLLDLETTASVNVPIRYGRLSNGPVYTMVFDKTLKQDYFGNAKMIALSHIFTKFSEIKRQAESLSHVEGHYDSTFIKGQKAAAWCVCSILINPKVEVQLRDQLLNQWSKELQINKVGYDAFIKDPALYSLTKYGELDIPWPDNAHEYDFLIATSTKPESTVEIPSKKISELVFNRPYFHPNIQHGIETYQDFEIINNQGQNIEEVISCSEHLLLSNPRSPFSFDKKWPNIFPNHPGVYAIYDRDEIVYFGETGNLKKRMTDLRRTVNHSMRRSLGFKLYGEQATTKKKFSEPIELKLNSYFEKQISISCMAIRFGRLEIEEYLIEKYSDRIFNKKKKRL